MRKRITSLLLTLAMLLSLVPAMGVTASAATSGDGFVEVSTYEQLKNKVDKGDAKVKLIANIDTTDENGGAGVTVKTALTFIGDGNILDLNGYTLKLVSDTGVTFFEVLKGLTIKDSRGGGRIDFEYGSSVIYRTTAIHVAESAGAKLTVESGTLSSTEDGITLIKCEGNLTIKGGKIETPITNSGVTPQTIYTFNSYGDGCKILISGGEIYGTTVFTRDDSSVEKFPQDGNYPIQITGGTMKGRVIPVWIEGGEPTNQTEYSPVIEITGGVIHNWGRTGFLANCKRLPTKVVEGSFKDGAIISVGDVKKTSEICVAALGQSAIRYNDEYGPSSQVCRGNGISGGTVNNGGIAIYTNEDNPVTVIPNAWGIKSVKLDGKEISYAKDWNGEPMEIDNSKDHILTYEWYPLLQGLQDCHYKYDAMFQRYDAGDSAGHGQIITSGTQYSYTIPKGIEPKLYTFNLALDMLHNGKPFLNGHNNHAVKLMVKEAPPTPTIEGSVYYTSGIVYGSPISIAASVTPTSATPAYQWQRSTDGGSTWTNIEGATSGKYTPVAADVGENVRIRVKVTAEGYLGEIVGAALKVSKAANNNYPEVIKLEAVKNGAGNYTGFKITNFDSDYEYVYSTTDTPNWSANQISSATVTGLTSNTTYYVFARFKETATHTAGSIVSNNSIMLYDYVPLDRVSLEGYDSGNTIYIKKGESVTLKVSADPSNANSWKEITFKDSSVSSLGTSNITISNEKIAASGTTATAFPNDHSITITGVSTGSATLDASYSGPTQPYYGRWYVVVYDDSTVANALRLENVYTYADITLSENDEAELPTDLPTLLPANSGYHLEWRILKRGTYGATYVTENDNIKLEDGKIKPKAAHAASEKAQLELVAVKDGSTEYETLPKKSLFYVTVTEAPVIELTGITVAPTKVNLELNATYQLSAVKEPVNAAGSLNWESSNTSVATVDSTGKVTAKAQGTATITVSCGDKKATCTVTVDHQHDYSGQPYLYLDPGNHYQECKAGDGYNIQAHAFTPWTDNGDGTHSRHCTVCKMTDGSTYTETANHDWQWVVDDAATPNAAGKQHEECVDCHAKRSENTVIPMLTSIMVENLTVAKPVKDAAAAAANTTDSDYYVANTEWMAADGTPLAIGGKFQPGTVYTVKITLETADAGVFSVKSTYNTIDGKTATVSPVLTGDAHTDSVILTYTFDATEGNYVPTKPAITTATLPDGKVGDAYNQTLAAIGTNPITWGIETGTLPDGLTLVDDTIKGTPSKAGDFKFTVKATNGGGSDTKELTIKVADADSAKYHTVTVTSGGNGIVSASHDKAVAGTEITLTATPNSGYHFKEWKVIKGSVAIKDNKFTMPAENVEVKAIFEKNASTGTGTGTGATTYAITVKSAKNGDVTASHKSASKGTTVTLTVAPDKGYVLDTLTVLDGNNKDLKLTEKNGKYTFTMPASKVTVEAMFKAAGNNPFIDVPAGSYYEDAVIWAVDKGITTGTSATTFNPNGICTRAQAVTFLWRAAGSPAAKSGAMPFADVKAGSYYYDAVLWAVEQGITKGTSDTAFSPNATCTRAQIVTFLWRANGSPAVSGNSAFTDVAADAYYAAAVTWAEKNGVTGGIGGGLFGSNNNCTRAQIVTFIYRSVK